MRVRVRVSVRVRVRVRIRVRVRVRVRGLLGEAVQLGRGRLAAAVLRAELRAEEHAHAVERLAQAHVSRARLVEQRLGEADQLRLRLRRPAVDRLELGAEGHPRRRGVRLHVVDLLREGDAVAPRLVHLG